MVTVIKTTRKPLNTAFIPNQITSYSQPHTRILNSYKHGYHRKKCMTPPEIVEICPLASPHVLFPIYPTTKFEEIMSMCTCYVYHPDGLLDRHTDDKAVTY